MSRIQTEMEELEDEWMGWFWGWLASNGRKRKKKPVELKDRIMEIIEENGREREELKDCFLLCRVRAHIRTFLIASYQAMAVLAALVISVLALCMEIIKGNSFSVLKQQGNIFYVVAENESTLSIALVGMLFLLIVFCVNVFFMLKGCAENRQAAFYRSAAELLEDRLKEEKGDVL